MQSVAVIFKSANLNVFDFYRNEHQLVATTNKCINLSQFNYFSQNNPVHGCVPALGYSFASGTIDGANTLNITQGTLTGNELLDSVAHLVAGPTEEDIKCHEPKPILLATGRVCIYF